LGKTKKIKNKHSYHLNCLVWNLEYIGLNPSEIKWIMKEGIWRKETTRDTISLCDLIVVTYKDHGIPIELKCTTAQRSKAIEQIYYGRLFIENNLFMFSPFGLFVTYEPQRYGYERIGFSQVDNQWQKELKT